MWQEEYYRSPTGEEGWWGVTDKGTYFHSCPLGPLPEQTQRAPPGGACGHILLSSAPEIERGQRRTRLFCEVKDELMTERKHCRKGGKARSGAATEPQDGSLLARS